MFKTPKSFSLSHYISIYTHTYIRTHTYIYKLIIKWLYLDRRMQLGVVKEILALPGFLLIYVKIIYSYIFFMEKCIF